MPKQSVTKSESQVFDISLSFAGEDRVFVQEVARELVAQRFLVFYDRYYEADLVGKDLVSYLRSIYADRSRYCAVFISCHYGTKRWPNLVERQAILDRATRNDDDYLIPVTLDSSWIEGLPKSTGYLDARNRTPSQVAQIIATKIGIPPLTGDEIQLFEKLASDPLVLGRFVITFRNNDEIDYYKYDGDQLYPWTRQAKHFGYFLATYDLCSIDIFDLGEFQLTVSLTEKGKRFAVYVKQHLHDLGISRKKTNWASL